MSNIKEYQYTLKIDKSLTREDVILFDSDNSSLIGFYKDTLVIITTRAQMSEFSKTLPWIRSYKEDFQSGEVSPTPPKRAVFDPKYLVHNDAKK